MRRSSFTSSLCLALCMCLLLTVATVSSAYAQGGKSQGKAQESAQQDAGLTPQQAAAEARAMHGGKVLKVTRQGKGYRVKLLLDSGRVISVMVKD